MFVEHFNLMWENRNDKALIPFNEHEPTIEIIYLVPNCAVRVSTQIAFNCPDKADRSTSHSCS
jgi:hypothetical protein